MQVFTESLVVDRWVCDQENSYWETRTRNGLAVLDMNPAFEILGKASQYMPVFFMVSELDPLPVAFNLRDQPPNLSQQVRSVFEQYEPKGKSIRKAPYFTWFTYSELDQKIGQLFLFNTPQAQRALDALADLKDNKLPKPTSSNLTHHRVIAWA